MQIVDNFDSLTSLAAKASERHLEDINAYLKPSHGENEIGTPELKLIIVTLQQELSNQMMLNAAMLEEIKELRKPSRLSRLLKKD